MNTHNLVSKLASVPPPIQPFIEAKALDYKQKLFRLNTVSNKSEALFYQFKTENTGENVSLLKIPDACLNYLFEFSEDGINPVILGMDHNPKMIMFKPNTEYFGIRPYSNFGMKGWKISPNEFYGDKVNLKDALSAGDLRGIISKDHTFEENINHFIRHYKKNWMDEKYIPTLPEYCALFICTSEFTENEPLSLLQDVTGYSDRYCRMTFKDTYNCSLKTYSKMVRFQTALNILLSPEASTNTITNIANDLGYFDEAHFNKDFYAFTGSSPGNLRKQIPLRKFAGRNVQSLS